MAQEFHPARILRRDLTPAALKRIHPDANGPEPWREAHGYDLNEIYGRISNRGYAYAYEVRRRMTLALIQEALAPGARILDVAAAQGNFSLALAELGYRVVWNDLRAELAGYVGLKHERGEIDYAPGNAFELGFGEEFDAVLIAEVIEHVAHPDDFLRQVAGMVRPGGCVIMSTPNGAYFKNTLPRFSECVDPSRFEAGQFKPNADGHIFLLWPDEVTSLAASAGLVVEKHLLFTTPLTNGHMKTEPLLRLLPRAVVMGLERAARALPAALGRRLMIQSATRFRKPVCP